MEIPFFNGNKTLKLSSQESILSILKEEDQISPAYEGFKKIIYSDQTESQRSPFKISLFNSNKLLNKYKNVKSLQEANEDIFVKLYLAYKTNSIIFNKIKDQFCEVFPQVEDIKVEPLDSNEELSPNYIKDHPFIQIKEIGVNKWIEQNKISSGMFRTLIHFTDMYLCPEGTVFLIDEFENSLGINCINELTNDILLTDRNIQFIITSHHPYIINNIDSSKWKLVTRNASVVKTHSLEKYNFNKSKHESFMQLMQLDEFLTGTEEI